MNFNWILNLTRRVVVGSRRSSGPQKAAFDKKSIFVTAFCCDRASKRGTKVLCPQYLRGLVSAPLHAEELDVNRAAEARIEEHVPAGMVVVVIDVDAVTVPFPVAATRNVVRRDDPI